MPLETRNIEKSMMVQKEKVEKSDQQQQEQKWVVLIICNSYNGAKLIVLAFS